ncbi:helix-turn-helix transcriptional regulator [Allonocardiopsis opalescens]|uniref:Helix-turn-helix protein n=1 Tax=Allonocardiopsis opalescens TaxID=1144618 RepID=A0A2T0QA56_9ACTN|nr:helix-turn-helix domain-containing protein [Allonocardiopsis opalescens]PRY00700.1 helix-turn-helix protein [Allonocardiopsis opalescens]
METRNLGTPPEVARHLGIPEKTLAQWRYLGKGPKWSKVGRHVRYRWSDVERWLDSQSGGRVA